MIPTRRFYTRSCIYQQNKTKLILRSVFYVVLISVVIGCSLYTIDLNLHISFKTWLRLRDSSLATTDTTTSSLYPSCLQPPYTTPMKETPPLTPGVPLTRLDECLGFAKSINSVNDLPQQQNDSIWFHTYWKDVSPTNSESATQLLTMLRSFSATQGHYYAKMKIWVHDEHEESLLVHSDAWRLAKQQMERQHQELAYDVWTKQPAASHKDWINMDYIGLLILQQHGGVWFHPSMVFVRDWSALIGKREWMIQYDCEATHTGRGSLIGSGLEQRTMMHFFANSTMLCQLIESASNTNKNLGLVYKTVYRNMIQNSIRPWSLLPWCFVKLADGCSSINTRAFQLFGKPKNPDHATSVVTESGAFALQYDADQWNSEPGTLMDLLDQAYRIKTGW